jgi:endonuclease/exonuclease/phosphatase family metal-dependent hydrolase
MRIATYNILKGGMARVHWTKMFDEQKIDLLLVQESYPQHEHISPLLYPKTSTCSVWEMVEENGWGSAVVANCGAVKKISVPMFAGWVVGAEIRNAFWQVGFGEQLLAFSVHAPSRNESYARQVNKLLDEIARITRGVEFVIGGDFNLTVSNGNGTGRPHTRHEVAIQSRLADEFSLINCWQEANSNSSPAQTLRWSRDRTKRYHCDGLFVPKSWKARLEMCTVLAGNEWECLSDHNPVIAAFRA